MLSRFFIDRPIFATVLSVVITLIGGIALAYLPIAQYPRITPPSVQVAITYPGASAQVVADSVAAPIEQQVNGVEGMLYMSSQSGNDGTYTLTVTFDVWVDLNTALVMVQNRVALAMPLLPTPVQAQGITIRKKTPDILMIVSFYSPDGRYDDIYLSNFALINVKDEILRVDGVSDVNIFGERDYSIRAWLNPQKLASMNMTANDVANAILAQNVEAAMGQIGQPPTSAGQMFQLPLDTLGRLTEPEQFGDIIIKTAGQPRPSLSSTSTPSSGSSGGSGGGMPSAIGNPLLVAGKNTLSSSGSNPTGLAGGANSAGGAGASGGANSTGGGTTGGGATAGGAMSGSLPTTGALVTGSADVTSNAPSDGTPPAVSDTGMTVTSLSGNGILSATGVGGSGPQPPSGSVVRLRDVARIELGALNYNQACIFDGKPSVGVSVYQLPGTNALEVAKSVRAKMKELSKRFPEGVRYTIGYDTTPYISESITEVFHTLRDAIILVAIVVLVFLQDWKAMILPMIDVPVSLIGTFGVMAAVGYSLNNISLFGLVLAIGIVVDDAIVVLENIERQMAKGYDTRTATIKAMEEISGPIIAITLVLCAVFVPCAFISGITGRFFRQFAVTIAASTVISAINALTMTPSRALVLFKTEEIEGGHSHKREALPWWIFGLCGLVTVGLGNEYLAGHYGLPVFADAETDPDYDVPSWLYWTVTAAYFTPGMLVGLALGWFIIRPVNAVLGFLFRAFNRGFDHMTTLYGWSVGGGMRLCVIVLVGYVVLLVYTFRVFQSAPTGFVPQQDMGRLIISVQLPDSASLERTKDALQQVEAITRADDGVAHTIGIAGISFIQQANGSNFGSLFVILKPFSERRERRMKDTAIMARLRREWAMKVPDAKVFVSGSSPIPGLSVAGGFKVMVEDRGGIGLPTLQDQTDKLIRKILGDSFSLTDKSFASLAAAGVPQSVLDKLEPLQDEHFNQAQFKTMLTKTLDAKEFHTHEAALMKFGRQAQLGLSDAGTQFRSNTPQLFMDVDRAKVASLGVSLDDVNQAIEIYLGSLYVNSYNQFGRHWQVTVQADGAWRNEIDKVNLYQVRNKNGQMVLMGTLATMRETSGPIFVQRYNLNATAPITGNLLPGVSSGTVIAGVDRIADDTLPRSMRAEWTELMYLQIHEGNSALVVFSLAVVCVFLALSALYESWTLPLAVILVVPLCILSSVVGVLWASSSVNIFVQIGLVVLVGLACKNAILVVEFAKQLHDEGRTRYEATLEASRLRLRPILMTSLAFILGVVPLVLANGAGAEMRRSLGTAVFSGMIGVTAFGIFLTPIFFYVIQGVDESRLFAAHGTRWAISCVVGGLAGMAFGFLLAPLLRLGLEGTITGMAVGAGAGILATLAALGIHQGIRARRLP